MGMPKYRSRKKKAREESRQKVQQEERLV